MSVLLRCGATIVAAFAPGTAPAAGFRHRSVAASPATDTEPMGVRSMTIPVVEDRPATECPPLRMAARRRVRRASPIVPATSAGVWHSTTAAGRVFSNRAMAGLRTDS
jgi:hypothetical protein